MRKTLAEHMKPNAFEQKHYTEMQQTSKALEVLHSTLVRWGASNLTSLNYIADLIDDVEKRHGSLQEVKGEVQELMHYLENQNGQLAEINPKAC